MFSTKVNNKNEYFTSETTNHLGFNLTIYKCVDACSDVKPFAAFWVLTYVRALCRATMKSGRWPLKTSLALAWTQTQVPVLVSSLKMVKPLSPVFITALETEPVSS